jgi:hypothetical protein
MQGAQPLRLSPHGGEQRRPFLDARPPCTGAASEHQLTLERDDSLLDMPLE